MGGNKKNVPKRRFKEFENAEGWEQCELGKLTDVYDGTHQTPNYTDSGVMFLSVENIKNLQSEKFISEEDFEKDFPIFPQKGDVLMTRIGDIGTANVVESDDPKAYYVSLALLKQKELNPYFLKESISSKAVKKELWKRTLHIAFPKKINKNEIDNVIVPYPVSKNEQQKIGELFQRLDNLITLHKSKLDKMKALKKAYLTEIFPAEGERNPKLRFEGFTDDWEQRKFGELADYKKGPFGSALTKDMFVPRSNDSVKVYEQQNAINKNWKLERYYIPKNYAIKLNSFEVHAGDIIVSCAGTIGEIYTLPKDSEPGIINQALMRVRVDENIVDKELFIYLFSNMIDLFSKIHSNGSAMKNIPPFSDLKPTVVYVPSMAEQKKLVRLLIKMDTLITLHQCKLQKLKNIKKAYLNEMFI